ncbi:hypothetical protein GUJ93_ZPchr0004g38791 [Zizania palustris]|uniref:Uncharacterized protein n=1 Tax=Zizania palustris TaxID=103762 RepID=A0A8J5S1G1_ZIZPA|nr:hypothetical protein GUJ93_ZPchr0004g38791 [Zizania palustris]
MEWYCCNLHEIWSHLSTRELYKPKRSRRRAPPPPHSAAQSMAPLFHMEALLPSSISPKINSVLHSQIYPQVGHVFRVLAKFKSFLLGVLSKKRPSWTTTRGSGKRYAIGYRLRPAAKSSKTISKQVAGFMKLPFTWATSSIAPPRVKDPDVHYYYHAQEHSYYDDSTWNVVAPADAEELRAGCGAGGDDADDCGYLCWLEEEGSSDVVVPAAEEGEDGGNGDGEGNSAMNEIDRLAERFIARCHAKFLLEKQESYRRYQEMMARSI